MVLTRALLTLSIAVTAFAQVAFQTQPDRVHVEIDGKPFGDLLFGPDTQKPYFAPLRSASGKIVTRRFPMEQNTGESSDHLHHRGLWLGYKDISGVNFWENEATYKTPNKGRIAADGVITKGNSIIGKFNWVDPAGKTLLTEARTMAFGGGTNLRTVDIDITLTAVGTAVFGDDKDGTFAVRLADPLIETKGGLMTNSTGASTMKEVWGKPADWVDYNGTLDGEKLGVAIFDHPSSFRHPTRWHSRDYGLFAANPFGAKAFDPAQPASEVTLKPGEKLHLRYEVVIHAPMTSGELNKMYEAWKKR